MSSCGCKHFKGDSALEHIAEVQAKGWLASKEPHSHQMPGFAYAFVSGLRDTASLLLLISLLLQFTSLALQEKLLLLGSLSFGWSIWKGGLNAWLSWTKLERLHRVLIEEKSEIEYHRDQEREELSALYQAKGLHGKLLHDVVDVLMADNDRLLKVMLEEELGYRLESYDHPLKYGLGAFLGSLLAGSLALFLLAFFGHSYALFFSIALVALSGAISALYEKNHLVNAVIWVSAISLLASGMSYFLLQYLKGV
ncbi:MAG: putative rane protein [Chlamydiales bacterium]|jgi:VIT1/CCC1 family predicted Fe2+/Mn2+ transporter|nr:putative rane protein [Chlamydiales bacterium]